MPSFSGTSWGETPGVLGDAGGVVTWSVAGAGVNIVEFGSAPFSVDPDSFLTIDYEAVIAQAFDDWSSFGNIDFMQVADTGGASSTDASVDIRIFFGSVDRFEGAAFFPASPPTASAGNILLDTKTRYNTDVDFLSTLVLHEIGHAIGLGHVLETAIMNQLLVVGSLQSDDIEGVQEIYGVQDGAPTEYHLPTGMVEIDILRSPYMVTVFGNALSNRITASDDAETLRGAEGDDTLDAGGGDDVLHGGLGADAMDGGSGTDTADYSDATDRVKIDLLDNSKNSGEAVGDTLTSIENLTGGSKKDTFLGDLGANVLSGQGGNDDLRGRSDRDTIFGGDGDDRMDAGKGRDRMEGEGGNDLMLGQRGADNLRGGQGDDTLDGGTENDFLVGGKGRDELIGGAGNDDMQGNGGSDTFIFAGGHGVDTIADFDAIDAREKLDFSGLSSLNSLNDVTGPGGAASQQGGDVLIDTGGGNSILLLGVLLTDLDSGDFTF